MVWRAWPRSKPGAKQDVQTNAPLYRADDCKWAACARLEAAFDSTRSITGPATGFGAFSKNRAARLAHGSVDSAGDGGPVLLQKQKRIQRPENASIAWFGGLCCYRIGSERLVLTNVGFCGVGAAKRWQRDGKETAKRLACGLALGGF